MHLKSAVSRHLKEDADVFGTYNSLDRRCRRSGQSPYSFWVTGLMGAHLIQLSFTGVCPVVALLKTMGFQQRAGFV